MNLQEAQAKVTAALICDPRSLFDAAAKMAPEKIDETGYVNKSSSIRAMRIALAGKTAEETQAKLIAFAEAL